MTERSKHTWADRVLPVPPHTPPALGWAALALSFLGIGLVALGTLAGHPDARQWWIGGLLLVGSVWTVAVSIRIIRHGGQQ